jgi:SAM-dependent methyltransferase
MWDGRRVTRSAAEFDRWYADRVESPVADELVRRKLDLPPDLQSTSLLSGAGLDEVVPALTGTGLNTASVDAVLIVDSIQFAESKLDALRECRRVLRPGGRLVITCWEALDATDERLPPRLRQVDLLRQLPHAGFVDVEVTGKPAWHLAEQALWQEALTIDAGKDLAVQSMQDEARRVLATFDGLRRVLATAFTPHPAHPSSP